MSRPHVLLYADVDLNVIDGSSVWAVSVADALAEAGARVTLLAKASGRDHRVVQPLLDRPEVRIIDPESNELPVRGVRLQPAAAAAAMGALDKQEGVDLFVVRGSALSAAMAAAGVGTGRTWCYLTDIPQSVGAATPERMRQLTGIASWAALLLCQTEQLRGFVEQMVPEAVGKTALLPPIIPDDAEPTATAPESAPEARLTLVYSGKHAPQWRTLEMCALPADLRKAGVDAELVMVGDKIHSDPNDPGYRDSMERALTGSDGVQWLGGVSRSAAMDVMGSADVGMAWRGPELDDSLELSTKLLEFGARGVPAVLNRTPMHEELLGADYPLFANDYAAVVDVLTRVAENPDIRKVATHRLAEAAAGYSRQTAVARLERLLSAHLVSAAPTGWAEGSGERKTVLVAGHDLKFIRAIAAALDTRPDTRLVTDVWHGHRRHDAAASTRLLREADVVLCEWMLGNAVWYSHNKQPGQRLVIRFHRAEMETDYPFHVDLDAVDAIVFVGPEIARLAIEKFGLPEDKVVIVPNPVDVAAFARTKKPGSEFALGLIGALPRLKRLDLAVDLVRRLRFVDPRYRLYVKSTAPWDLPWMWKKPEQREYYERILHDIAADPELSDAVVFDQPGPDVAEWFRKVGWVVSPSDIESFHLAAAEGMASGAVPLIRNWAGARDIYGDAWVHDDVAAMVDTVSRVVGSGEHAALGRRAAAEVARFDLPDVVDALGAVLADRDPNTARFWGPVRGNA
jgi:glycosyltransferase involved in cell wall biosynthesis